MGAKIDAVVSAVPVIGDAAGIASSVVHRGGDAVKELASGDVNAAKGSLAAGVAEIAAEAAIPDNPAVAAAQMASAVSTGKRIETHIGDAVKDAVVAQGEKKSETPDSDIAQQAAKAGKSLQQAGTQQAAENSTTHTPPPAAGAAKGAVGRG